MERVVESTDVAWAPVKRISWSAVFAGVLITVLVQMLLSLLGISIGMSTINPVDEQNPAKGLGTGALIWYSITSLMALFAGGWIAGRLAQTPRRFDAFLHGVLTWCVVTLLTFYLLSTAVGNIVGGVGKVVGKTLGAAGNMASKGIEMAAPKATEAIRQKLEEEGIDLGDIKREANQLMRETGKEELQPKALKSDAKKVGQAAQNTATQAAASPQSADESAEAFIDQIFQKGRVKASEIDREAAVNVIVAKTGKSEAEANQIVDNWIKTYEQLAAKFEQAKEEAERRAREAGQKAADEISKAAMISFVSLIIGALVAGFGAKGGSTVRHRQRMTTT